MTPRLLIALMATGLVVAGCASGGGTPRPRPFPGAELPPARDAERNDTAAPVTPDLVTTALGLRGTPYRNGGSEPSRGFDCSGFVQWVFSQHGARLPRETRQQFGIGATVAADEVQPGDLVFFETVSRGPSHVGIALGGGEFVHAPSSRGVVRVEQYTSGYWSARWLGARRVSGIADAAAAD